MLIMSYELAGIILLGVAELGTFAISLAISLRALCQMEGRINRTQRAIAALIVQESEKIQELLRD